MASTDSNELKLKLLQVAQKNCELLGVCVNGKRLNAKTLIILYFLWSASLFNFIFLCCEAKTFREFSESIFYTLISAMIATCFTIIVIRMNVLFNLIYCAERVANKSDLTFQWSFILNI